MLLPLGHAQIHQRLHRGPQQGHQAVVAVAVAIHLHAANPQQGVVDDGVDVGGHRLAGAEGQQGALFQLPVGGEVAVDEQALVGVAAPDPFVPLDAVQNEGPAAQGKGVGRHGEDTVEGFIVAVKAGLHGDVHILVDGPDGVVPHPAIGDKGAAQGLPGAAAGGAVGGAVEIAPSCVQRLRAGLPQVHHGQAGAHHLQGCRQLRGEGVEHTAVYGLLCLREVDFFRIGPLRRVTEGIGKVAVKGGGHRRGGKVLHRPAPVGADGAALYVDGGHAADAAHVDGHGMLPRRAENLCVQGVFCLVQQHVAHRAGHGPDGERVGRCQGIAAAEHQALAEALAFPEGGPAHAPLHPGEILPQGVVALKVAGIPQPIACLVHSLNPLWVFPPWRYAVRPPPSGAVCRGRPPAPPPAPRRNRWVRRSGPGCPENSSCR